MKTVEQRDLFGCGAACVAFVLKEGYSKVVILLERDKARSKGFFCKDLTRVLLKFGQNYSYKYLKPRLRKKIYKKGVIVFIRRSKRYPTGHFLVRHSGLWMDPWVNFTKDNKISNAKAGFRKRLPGKPIYMIFPIQ